ncbi:MAG: c-type cytochrome [Methylovirgula sp.]
MPRFLQRPLWVALAVAGTVCLAGCDASADDPGTGGNAAQGAKLIRQFGCGSCHMIPGIEGADGLVGPPLEHMGERTIIAGLLPNTPQNMEAWLENPQAIVPGNAMPNMELTDNEAKDVAAYLYTLR